MKKQRVLLGMSGGIDSSFVANLLQEKGFEVIGITFKLWELDDEQFIQDAKDVAKRLNFQHYVLDVQDKFEKTIIKNFVGEYMSGKTPNPCILCNIHIKWDMLLSESKKLNCDYISTGHYANIEKINNRYVVIKAKDELKDQSYFLWGLPQDVLEKVIFPLGKYLKTEVRELAKEKGFVKLASKKESFDVCFIPDGDYRNFLKKRVKNIEKNLLGGNFIDKNNKILGQHKGYPFYTIGQRKGLEIAVGYPLYVLKIDAETNTITLGKQEELFKQEMWVKDFNLIKYDELPEKLEVSTKIRYRNKGTFSTLIKENNQIKIIFHEPVSAITKGQSAVFYENEQVVGGGIIL